MCAICGRRPANGVAYCTNCLSKLESERRHKAKPEAKHYLTYRGHVVGLFPNGDGTLSARLLQRNPDRLPKGKTIDLNRWCDGFSREKIKAFKACVLKLAHA